MGAVGVGAEGAGVVLPSRRWVGPEGEAHHQNGARPAVGAGVVLHSRSKVRIKRTNMVEVTRSRSWSHHQNGGRPHHQNGVPRPRAKNRA